MLVAVVAVDNEKHATDQIKKIQLSGDCDCIEIRLDYFHSIDLKQVEKLRGLCELPVIFTLRKKSQGGFYKGREESRLKLIRSLLLLKPDYFDLEYDVPENFIKDICVSFSKTKLICSYHDFQKTPNDIFAVLSKMIRSEFLIYKIATHANSTIDSLRMMNFVLENRGKLKIVGICMGEMGAPTRILAPVIGSELNYSFYAKSESSAPGQLDVDTLIKTYNYKRLNKETKVFSLLGDPVDHSIGHIFHNKIFNENGKNAVYIKMKLQKKELSDFFALTKRQPFKGFSVTMPLKEEVLNFIDEPNEDGNKMKSINTIFVKKGKVCGFNTDGIGALNEIEKRLLVKDKKVVVVGAGGTARSITYEAVKRGAKVTIINRTLERAAQLAKEFSCLAYGLDYVPKLIAEGYDVLINTTSIGMDDESDLPIFLKETILPRKTVLDMVYKPETTKFLKFAESKKCTCVSGYEVFVAQALEQDRIWLQI